MKKSLRERTKEFQNALPFMEGRDKGVLKDLQGQIVTIKEFGFMQDNENEYVCFTIEEDNKNFYFGGTVLTDQLMALDEEGYRDEIEENGLPTLFKTRTSKNNRTYTDVSFYPED